MQKFPLIILVLCLSACNLSLKPNNEKNSPHAHCENQNCKENENEEKTNEYEIFDDGDISADDFSLASFKQESNWSIENAEYYSEINKQMIYLDSGKTASLHFDELYLFPDDITISFNYESNFEHNVYFEIYDDSNDKIFEEKVLRGENRISFKNPNQLYKGHLNFKIESKNEYLEICIENFKICYSEDINLIHLNQIGYTNEARKIAVFSNHQGDYYNVVDAANGDIVLTLPLSKDENSIQTNEYVSRGDFTKLSDNGEYYLESSMGFKSYIFAVKPNVYSEILNDAINMFSAQRCGIEISEDVFPNMGHGVCHNSFAKYYSTSEPVDVRGGWHDAGDYGRYVDTAVKALSDLLIGYMIAPDSFEDIGNGLNKNNGIPDVLDEARYELEWLFKMQGRGGEVYSRAITKQFPGNILPEEDNDEIYVMPVSTSSTAGFTAVMAISSIVYAKFDQDFAHKCLEASKLSYDYLNNNDEYNFDLPDEFSAGDYTLAEDEYYRFYAAIALWFSTDEKSYLNDAFKYVNENYNLYNVYWEPLMAYPSFLYLYKANENDSNYEFVFNNFYGYLDRLCEGTGRDSYRISLNETYTWGSNQNVADRAMLLLMGYHLSGKRLYKAIAEEHLDYLLGKNFHNMSFVVGYGEKYPQHIHHRVAICKDSEFKGALVGGPDASMEDSTVLKAFEGKNYGPARIYVDNEDSYSTNEVAIHFNSALVFVLAYLNQGE